MPCLKVVKYVPGDLNEGGQGYIMYDQAAQIGSQVRSRAVFFTFWEQRYVFERSVALLFCLSLRRDKRVVEMRRRRARTYSRGEPSRISPLETADPDPALAFFRATVVRQANMSSWRCFFTVLISIKRAGRQLSLC